MISNMIGAVLAAAGGYLIALVNYVFSKNIVAKKPEKIPTAFVARQILQVAYLVLVYLVGAQINNINVVFLLAGAAVGMTFPMFFFTRKLLMLNDADAPRKAGKEEENDG